MSDVCSHCHGIRLVGWSGTGPHFCRECSRDVSPLDAFDVITWAWREQRTLVSQLTTELAEWKETSESWRLAHQRWQDWAKALLEEHGRQLLHGEHGDEASREIIAQLASFAPGVPRCMRCGCFSSRHEVDDEELRECADCECEQFEMEKP